MARFSPSIWLFGLGSHHAALIYPQALTATTCYGCAGIHLVVFSIPQAFNALPLTPQAFTGLLFSPPDLSTGFLSYPTVPSCLLRCYTDFHRVGLSYEGHRAGIFDLAPLNQHTSSLKLAPDGSRLFLQPIFNFYFTVAFGWSLTRTSQ